MKRFPRGRLTSGLFLVFALLFTGCGGDDDPVFVAEILSDQPSDGDIGFLASSPTPYILSAGPSLVIFGFDGELREYRAFFDFPLDGSTGFDSVPLDARIESASLLMRIVSMDFATAVPTLVDLVTYTPRALSTLDFDSAPLATRSAFNLFSSDVGQDVEIDVTSLMQEAQALQLSDLQVRFLLDFVPGADGLVGIDDQPAVAATAPTLIVRFR